jgi:hypothetical protein
MKSLRPFQRKIIYLCVMPFLLLGLLYLGHPATKARPGGVLAQLRNKYKLSESRLGDVDATSATIKLCTLGMRGVAAQILHEKAIGYKMRKDWANLGATLIEITKVQPNFVNIWVNQAWNLSYNVSVEFDDYRERYRWVIKGFKFLQDGIEYNKKQPKIPWELGRYVSQKIGKADEVKQYRALFAEDSDYRESLPVDLRDSCLDYRGKPDNWLVGKGWYQKGLDVFLGPDCQGPLGQSRLIGFSSPAMCQMSYADFIEKDGTFGEVAQHQWALAGSEWRRFGEQETPSGVKQKDSDDLIPIRLNDYEAKLDAAKRALAEFDKLVDKAQPNVRKELTAEKTANLPKAEQQALKVAAKNRTEKEQALAMQAEEAIKLAPEEIARKLPAASPEQRKVKEAAKNLAAKAREDEMLAAHINSSRNVVNFSYWKRHAETEQERKVIEARQTIYKADRAYASDDPVAARNLYDKGLKLWRAVLDAHPEYVADQCTCDDLMDMIKRYRQVLRQRDEPFPPPGFQFDDVIESYKRQTGEDPGLFGDKAGRKKKDAAPPAKKPDGKKPEAKHAEPIAAPEKPAPKK